MILLYWRTILVTRCTFEKQKWLFVHFLVDKRAHKNKEIEVQTVVKKSNIVILAFLLIKLKLMDFIYLFFCNLFILFYMIPT